MRTAAKALAPVAVAALCLALAATGVAGSKTPRISVVVDPTNAQVLKGSKRKKLHVTAQLDSQFGRCERQRSVVIYRARRSGGLSGPPLGKATSQGGGDKGLVTITATSPTKIKPTDGFLAIAAQRKVKIKGKEFVCKRGVSAAFSANSI